MIQHENDCVGCELPCIGDRCPYRNVPHYYCDECGTEEELYELDDRQLCADCVIRALKKVKENNHD